MTFAAAPITETLFAIMVVLTSCGCFLVGVNLMSKGFVQATEKQGSLFTRGFNCKTRFGGFGAGLVHTMLAQSSDVTSVTLVRLADVGFITLFQACACIIGANVGTTITTFIVSLSAFNITPYIAFLAFVGAIPLLSKRPKMRIFGHLVAGLGILFIGLQLLSANLQNEAFRDVINFVFNSTDNALLLIAIGVGLTMVVQSSSVVTSMVVFLIAGALLPIESALPLVVGANIGTCVTSWIAAFGSSRTARQTALFHTMFNLVGAGLFVAVLYTPLKEPFFNVVGSVEIHPEFKVALFHLAFNLCAAVVMIPLLRPAVWFCKKIVRH